MIYTVYTQHWDSLLDTTVEADSPEEAATKAAALWSDGGEFTVVPGAPVRVYVETAKTYRVKETA